jgi:LacI family transcriptional regulator
MHGAAATCVQLMLEGAASGSNIAEKCGFTTLQYMHAVFRRELGCTPKEYQMSYQKTQACSSEQAHNITG